MSPSRGILELWKPQPWSGFTWLGKELLNQPLFVLPQGTEFPLFSRDQLVKPSRDSRRFSAARPRPREDRVHLRENGHLRAGWCF